MELFSQMVFHYTNLRKPIHDAVTPKKRLHLLRIFEKIWENIHVRDQFLVKNFGKIMVIINDYGKKQSRRGVL